MEDPMRPYDPRGVRTRLSIQEGPAGRRGEEVNKAGQSLSRWDSRQEGFSSINKGERGGSTTKMRDARVLYHTANKVHLVTGVERWEH